MGVTLNFCVKAILSFLDVEQIDLLHYNSVGRPLFIQILIDSGW